MQSASKTKITVSRLWDQPQITTTLSTEGISITMSGEDLKVALSKELGQCVSLEQVSAAIDAIVLGMKMETAKTL
jgi:hypothetical protein